ncbi:AhpC/TSA family protein [Bizionia argentinensis JUB59]|uniref:AhpC/TSA family protein n=1 Tax=Bizionia argentinensis JUB59 TaxID=1046627 RepID=G2EFI2_9FLAO|nr:TlpA disulfide reductase family protein [Bizionia argentinensis]EGV42793.1 AhpC/TSA family protein [Bizionia argentinensis JUB59]
MIKKLTLLSFIILLASCQESNTDGYAITGSIDKSLDGKVIKIQNTDMNNPTVVDSSIVKDGQVTFKGSVPSTDLFVISIEGMQGGMPIMLENETFSIEFYKDSLQASIVTGSKENDVFQEFRDISDEVRKKNETMGQEFMAARTAGDSVKMTSIQTEFQQLVDAANKENAAAIKKHNDAVTSAAILENLLNTKNIEAEKATELYDNFTETVKNSRMGENISGMITASKNTNIGSVAPNFSAPNPEGKMVSLNDIKGKITIIDFWAAWCAPCRRENPNVVKVYEKYHEKGLEIIGVSLDGTPRQTDAKDEWLTAIEKDGLTWHQVSNLDFFNDPIAKLYNIQAIPATFILDSEGKIIAKDLRGPALEAKIKELLD